MEGNYIHKPYREINIPFLKPAHFVWSTVPEKPPQIFENRTLAATFHLLQIKCFKEKIVTKVT